MNITVIFNGPKHNIYGTKMQYLQKMDVISLNLTDIYTGPDCNIY